MEVASLSLSRLTPVSASKACSSTSSSSFPFSKPGISHSQVAASPKFAIAGLDHAVRKRGCFLDIRLRFAASYSPSSKKNVICTAKISHRPENRLSRSVDRGLQTYTCIKRVAGYFSVNGSYSETTEEGDQLLPDNQTSIANRISRFQDAFWRFLRPHTIRGTIIGTTAVVVRALIDNSHLIDWALLPKALRGLLALLCGNGYIVGINQIYDIGIDRVNKPFLPVAAGDLSVPAAWALVIALAVLGITIVATNFGPLITGLYSFGLFLGAIYSVPPLRLKQYAVAAFLIIATVRGFLLNFGVYYATRASLGLTYTWSPPILFITSFVTIFATVIAITKDLADVEGDRKFQISTFATKLGVRNIAFLGSGLLLINYLGAIVAAYVFPEAFRKAVMVVGHTLLSVALIYQTWLLNASKYSKEAIAVYYRFIWNLFYAEYIMFPFI